MKKEKAKRIARRITAFAAAVAMAATFTFPTEIGEGFFDGFGNAIVASAAETSGTCGTNLTWTFDGTDKLTISGTGEMTYWFNSSEVPWYNLKGSIKSVVIENGVTYIGDCAFRDCTCLTSVIIPNSVTYIGHGAFRGCTGLTSVTIPNSVTSIQDNAFLGCTGLTSIIIPDSVTFVGSDAFCETGFYNNGSNWDNGILYIGNYLIDSKNTLTSAIIKDGTVLIADSAFDSCTGLTSVTIPNSVTSIGDSAFYGCTGLTSIIIPDSVTYIDIWAFSDCTNLTSITIGNGITTIGPLAFAGTGFYNDGSNWENGILYIGNYLIVSNNSLTSASIKDGTVLIADRAFEDCTGLTSVTIPNSVTSIGNSAFYKCTGLTSVIIPNSVTSIGNWAFAFCSRLTSVTIPNSVTSIGNVAFGSCTGLTSVTIPNSVTSIGDDAFSGCRNLTSIFLPNTVDVSSAGISGTTTQIKYTVESESTVINEVKLGTSQTDCSLPATLFEKPVYLADASLETCPTVTHDHREKTAANCTEKPVCAICVQEYDEHTHVPADDYSKDETGHWHACSGCNEKVDFERHTEDSGTVTTEPTETTEGVKTFKCVKCGYVMRTEAIAPLGTSDPITAFVERLYLNILNRPSDPSKITHIDNLNNGESACKVAYDFVFSSEFAELPISNEERVRRMYLTFLNREADPAGLADWTAVLDNGCSIGHIFYGFTQSNEFTEICGEYGINRGTWEYTENRDRSSKLTAFVSRLYTKAMGRAYDVNGLNDHTGNYLENRDLYQLAYNFIFSSEFIEKNLTNEEFVDVMYCTFFDREADPAGKADWLDRMANQGYTREDVLAGFVGSQECADLVARFGI